MVAERTHTHTRPREREEKKKYDDKTTNVFKVIAKFDKIMNVVDDDEDDNSLKWCISLIRE